LVDFSGTPFGPSCCLLSGPSPIYGSGIGDLDI
jgi:hypothetical protein